VARSPLATARKQVSDEMKKVTREPNSVSTETKLASRKHLNAVCKAKSAFEDFWIE